VFKGLRLPKTTT